MRWIMAKIITLEGREVHLMKGSSLYWSSYTNYSRQTSQGLTGQGIARVFFGPAELKGTGPCEVLDPQEMEADFQSVS